MVVVGIAVVVVVVGAAVVVVVVGATVVVVVVGATVVVVVVGAAVVVVVVVGINTQPKPSSNLYPIAQLSHAVSAVTVKNREEPHLTASLKV